MKRNFYLIAIFLTTLLCITAGKNLFSQTTQLSSAYNNAVNIELDKFLYANPIDGTSSYEFLIEDLSSGQSQTTVKNTNYFSLKELEDFDISYNTAYSIKARAVTESSNWGSSVRVTTVENKTYIYGQVRLQFKQNEYFKFMSFRNEENLVVNSNIEGFDELAQVAGIREFKYSNKKILELTGRSSNSCVDLIFDESFSVDSIINFFNTKDYIEFVEPHYIYHLTAAPSEYNSTNPNFWHLRDIDASGAWSITQANRQNVIIAVIDNVFDIDHIDLRKNIYVNTKEIPSGTLTDTNGNGVIDADDLLTYYSTRGYSSLRQLFSSPPVDAIFNGVDNDGNGYIDDICGWSIRHNNNSVVPSHLQGDFLGHGTHVAGIAGAVANNGGICALSNNNVRILPVKLARDNFPYTRDNSGDIIDAFEYILNLEEKPNIISMSLGGFDSPYLREAVQILEERYNILCVAGTGNGGQQNSSLFPAWYPNVIAVGASTNTNVRASFSGYGNIPGAYVLAPGKDIYSTIAGNPGQNLYANNDGTSMSTPLVSSLAGLLYSYNPNISPEYARQAIICGCNNNPNQISNYNPANDGSGKINANQTLLCLKRMRPVANIEQTVGFYCPGSHFYRFNGESLTSVDNCTYYWTITGIGYALSGGNTSPNLNIRFINEGVFTINLRITNPNGTSNYSVEIEVKKPSISILNGDLTETCKDYNTNIYLQMEGNPPFRINYSFNGITTNLITSENTYNIELQTSSMNAGVSNIFRINSFLDVNCNGNTAQTTVRIKDCLIQCGGKYNQIWHFNPGSMQNTYGFYFNPNPIFVDNVFNRSTASIEGSASISNYDGNPILSISGGKIYSTKSGCNNIIINTQNANANPYQSSTQGNLILPNTSNQNQYYVLTVTEIRSTQYSNTLSFGMVDFSNSSCGEYIRLGFFSNNEYEKLTSCRMDGENGYWILTHNCYANKINIYKLKETDNSLTFMGSQNLNTTPIIPGPGEMKFDLSMNYLAIAYLNSNKLELYKFNRNSNYAGNRLELLGTKTINEPFSFDFSPNSRYIYINAGVNLIQIPVTNFSTSTPVAVGTDYDSYVTGVALAADNKIYVNRGSMGFSIVNNPDAYGAQCNYIPNVYQNSMYFNFPPRVPTSYADINIETYITDCSSRIRTINPIGTPTQYTWSTGAITPEITVTEAGTYSVTVIFSNGCALIRTIDITQANIYISPEFTDIQVHHPCDNQNNGYISVTVSGGRQPYTYRWTNSLGQYIGNQPTLLNLRPGLYRLTVRDALGCIMTTEQTLYPTSSPVISVELINNICQIGDGGSAEVRFEDFNQYQYLWSNGETTRIATNLPAGINYVTVTDLNGCFTTASINIIDVNANPIFRASETCFVVQDNRLYFFPNEIPSSDWHLYNFTWQINDGRTLTGAEMYPMFQYEGYYCITLNVERDGCYTSHTESIYVYPGDCYCDSRNYDFADVYISENTSWNDLTVKILNKLIVDERVTLQLKNCKLQFGPNGGIIISAKGKIESYSTLFTSFEEMGCDHMWQGIEVTGNQMMPSLTAWQGTLIIDSRSEIRNAHIAVLLGNRIDYSRLNICNSDNSDMGTFNIFTGGGLIQTIPADNSNTKFTNNGIHIKAVSKRGTNDASGIKIYNSLFYCNGQLLDARYNSNNPRRFSTTNYQNPWITSSNEKQRTIVGIDFDGQKNIAIDKCKFYNTETGIISMNAKFNVFKSSFINANCGIALYNSYTGIDSKHEIAYCNFDEIYYNNNSARSNISAHILMSASNYNFIHDNYFGSASTIQSLSNYGIYSNNSSSFNIIENDFTNILTGVHIINSSRNGGFIGSGLSVIHDNWTGNEFNRCKTSISTSSSNPNLKLKCNNCYNDFNQLYEVNFKSQGTLANQGSMPVNNLERLRLGAKKAAGNELRGLASSPKKIRSLTNSYSYFHHSSPDYTIPDVSTSTAPISLASVGVAKGTRASACNPQLEDIIIIVTPDPDVITIPDWGITAPIDWHISRIDSLEKLIEEYQLQYSKIIDNLDYGNKDYILKEIYNEKPSSQLADDLIKISPLSDEVLIALITEYPVNHYSFFNIMQYNMPVSREVEEYLMARLETLPEKEREMILSMQAFNEYNEKSHGNLRNYIDALKMDRQLYLNSFISSYAKSENYELTTAKDILLREDNISSLQTVISTYIAEFKYETAREALDKFENKIQEDGQKIWISYTRFLLDLYENDRDLYSLTKSEKIFLREIAEDCNAGLTSANAQSILIYYYGETFKECEDMPTKAKKFVKEVDYNKFLSQAYISDNYPEPFTNETYVDYYIPQGSKGQVKIMDIFGRIVTEYNIEEGTNTLKIDLSDFTNGVYTYGLIVDGKAIDYKKMVLTR